MWCFLVANIIKTFLIYSWKDWRIWKINNWEEWNNAKFSFIIKIFFNLKNNLQWNWDIIEKKTKNKEKVFRNCSGKSWFKKYEAIVDLGLLLLLSYNSHVHHTINTKFWEFFSKVKPVKTEWSSFKTTPAISYFSLNKSKKRLSQFLIQTISVCNNETYC